MSRLALVVVAAIAIVGFGLFGAVTGAGQTATYLNTGRDLVANMLGAAVAGVVVAGRVRSAAADAAGSPLGH